MNQATRTVDNGCTAEEYAALLAHVRHDASVTKPDIYVSGLQRHGGVWYAVTSAGVIPTRDLAAPRAQKAAEQ